MVNKANANFCCNKDFCDVSEIVDGSTDMQREADRKLDNWIKSMNFGLTDPLDYDLPGSSTREMGV